MTLWLAEMTAKDVATAIEAGATTVILPLGSTEQHGAHLPLGTDSFRAAALAERLAHALGDALVAPVLPIGCSDEHTGFAGLIGLDHATLANVVADAARRMAGWGVRRLVVLSAHGGNAEALELARARLQDAPGTPQLVICCSAASLGSALEAVAAADGISPAARGLHAGEWETSEMLHLRPDLVHIEHARPGYVGRATGLLDELRQSGVRAIAPEGVLGDPRCACARRGARYLAAQATLWEDHVTAAGTREAGGKYRR